MKFSEKILLVTFIIVIGCGAFFYFRDGDSSENNSSTDSFSIGGLFGLGGNNNTNIPDVGEGSVVKKEDLKESYKDTAGDFSFKYEEGMKATSNTVDEGEIITVEKDAENGLALSEVEGFQVFVVAFDEEGPLTAERIRQDLSDMVIDDAVNITVDGVSSLAFYSTGDLGDTFEVWAVNDGKLYQIMTKRGQERWLRGILQTWEWN